MGGDIIFEDKNYECQMCHLPKVKKRRDSNYTPKWCKDCRSKVQGVRLRATGLAALRTKYEDKNSLETTAPDGFPIKVKNQQELDFYQKRLKDYNKDFEFISSADLGLLTRLLLIELQIHRLNRDLRIKQTGRQLTIMTKLTEEYRRCQQDLGVVRSKRIQDKQDDNVAVIIADILNRYKKFREEHPEKFNWKCMYCGKINRMPLKNEIQHQPRDQGANAPGNGSSRDNK